MRFDFLSSALAAYRLPGRRLLIRWELINQNLLSRRQKPNFGGVRTPKPPLPSLRLAH